MFVPNIFLGPGDNWLNLNFGSLGECYQEGKNISPFYSFLFCISLYLNPYVHGFFEMLILRG
jgi:hypothetical protein